MATDDKQIVLLGPSQLGQAIQDYVTHRGLVNSSGRYSFNVSIHTDDDGEFFGKVIMTKLEPESKSELSKEERPSEPPVRLPPSTGWLLGVAFTSFLAAWAAVVILWMATR